MAEAIGEQGFKLHIWARRPASLSAVAAVPHVVHDAVADLAASVELIGLCLRDDTDIWNLLDDQRLLANTAPGTIIVNHGTGDLTEAEWIGAHVAEEGAVSLDAPVRGGPGARACTLTTCGRRVHRGLTSEGVAVPSLVPGAFRPPRARRAPRGGGVPLQGHRAPRRARAGLRAGRGLARVPVPCAHCGSGRVTRHRGPRRQRHDAVRHRALLPL
ncbi:NAD(P)-binding domain-containing protein [Streptomyces sp. NPDC055692]|uniref:NAD(P)-binding domain-containing protein n=1 Tax=Streptomyces sp. NPDC055692 TaxID=3155683 RepID=UPI003436D0AB